MGAADIIPGVSGGTMALIMGIYPRLIEAISNINLRWFPSVVKIWFQGDEGDKKNAREHFNREFWRMDPIFLFFLSVGIFFAFAIGSLVITYFIDNYPVLVQTFFFGLILASSLIPLREVRKNIHLETGEVLEVITVGIIFLVFAFVLTAPEVGLSPPLEWVEVTSRGEELSRISTRAMSAYPQGELLASPQNEDVTVKNNRIPAGEKLSVPRLPVWYLFLAAVIAICAMILPGISGAYILLILGGYYYLLNIFDYFQRTVAGGAVALVPLGYLVVFGLGAVVGLLIFSRVISYVLDRWPACAMAALTGLMLGGLHGLWPFYLVEDSPADIWPQIALALFAGIFIVSLFNYYAGGLEGASRTDG